MAPILVTQSPADEHVSPVGAQEIEGVPQANEIADRSRGVSDATSRVKQLRDRKQKRFRGTAEPWSEMSFVAMRAKERIAIRKNTDTAPTRRAVPA